MAKAPAKKTTAEKKPAVEKKAATAKVATKKPVEKKTVAKKTSTKTRSISAEERYKMIEVAAYYIAERHSFKGSTIDFWVAAEAEINAKIGK